MLPWVVHSLTAAAEVVFSTKLVARAIHPLEAVVGVASSSRGTGVRVLVHPEKVHDGSILHPAKALDVAILHPFWTAAGLVMVLGAWTFQVIVAGMVCSAVALVSPLGVS